MDSAPARLDRRRFAALGGAGLLGAAAAPLAPRLAAAQPAGACVDGAAPDTPRQTAGPFHLDGAPFRDDLRVDGLDGDDLTVRGRVLDVGCRPVAGAVLDVWQADPAGRYDNEGFRLRGRVRTDADGAYEFLTLKPGPYGAGFVRTPHIHVRVAAEGMRRLTTQVYFPDEGELNAQDALYREDLLLGVSRAYDGLSGRFDFVLRPA